MLWALFPASINETNKLDSRAYLHSVLQQQAWCFPHLTSYPSLWCTVKKRSKRLPSWLGYRVEMCWKMQDRINTRSLLSCPMLSLKWNLNMDFWALWEEGGHWSVIRVEYGPELGLCYLELSPQHHPLVGEEIQTAPRINLEKLQLSSLLSLNSGSRTITLGSRKWSYMELPDALSGHSYMNDFCWTESIVFFL